MELNGIYTALITPFNKDNSVNKNAYEQVINKVIQDEVHGVVVAGSTGENYSQTLEERINLIELTSKIINKRVSLIVGIGGVTRTEDSIVLGKKAKLVGADAIMISSPPYAVPTSKENAINSLIIDNAIDLPILLYNYPGRTGVHMDKEYLDIISVSNNFRWIKESSGELSRIDFLIKNYPNIKLCCGMDDQALEYFQAGVKSWVCAGSNFSATAHLALWKSFVVEKNLEKAKKIWSSMLPLMKQLEQGGKFIQSIKHGVSITGIDAGIPRLPLQPLDDNEKILIEKIITKMNNSIREIN
ncbi:MAG: dihydrodipicolinate synthase family protein [Alphaproteobacteria bacterium]|nr:dihydrodipicolinate synthase family protein [Alphaproteobacteria bacterium]